MAGNSGYQLFYLIPEDPAPAPPVLDLPDNSVNQCCGDDSLKVLADTASNDELRNDRKGFIYWFNPAVSDVVLELWKYDDAEGDYVLKDTLDDSTYGTELLYGDFVNSDGEKFVGYLLNWKDVLNAFGEGGYKVKRKITFSYGGTASYFSEKYCLKTYTDHRANRTVRLEYYVNSIMGDAFDSKKKKNFVGLNWYDSVRLSGYFNFSKPTYKEEYNQYQNNSQRFIESERTDEYELKLIKIQGFVEKIIRNDFNQADQRFITDYNNNTPESIVQLEVNRAGKYDPKYYKLQKTFCDIEASYNPTFNNNKKLRN